MDGGGAGTPGKRTLTERLPIQRKAAVPAQAAMPAGDDHDPTAAPATGGSPLPAQVRSKMERGFGADFSDVRVHVGDRAAAIGATAYARGNDIHFAHGTYDPHGQAGQALLGHELAHVVQQRAGRVHATQGKGAPIDPDAALEAEAETLGARVAAGEIVAPSSAGSGAAGGGATVQRSQRDNTRLPTEDEQTTLEGHLDPSSRKQGGSGGQLPPWDSKDEQALGGQLFKALSDYYRGRQAEIEEKKKRPRVPMGNDPSDGGVLQIVAHANQVLTDEYGAWVKASIRTPAQLQALSTPPKIIDGSDKRPRLELLGVNEKQAAMNTAYWILKNDQAAKAAMQKLNFSYRRTTEEKELITNILRRYFELDGSRVQKMMDLTLYCMNEHTDRGIALDTKMDIAKHGENAERYQRWLIFHKSLHELLHGLAHPGFMAACKGRPVMREGFCEYFAAALGRTIMNEVRAGNLTDLRRAIEGMDMPFDPSAIPEYRIPSDYAQHVPQVEKIENIVGGNGLRAAYFQGHVELLGLAHDGERNEEATPEDGRPRVHVPPGVDNIAQLVVASGLDEATIRKENPGIEDPLLTGQDLILPMCRDHVMVTADDNETVETRAHVARQHDIAEASLIRANPGLPLDNHGNWPRLYLGSRVLVPAT